MPAAQHPTKNTEWSEVGQRTGEGFCKIHVVTIAIIWVNTIVVGISDFGETTFSGPYHSLSHAEPISISATTGRVQKLHPLGESVGQIQV